MLYSRLEAAAVAVTQLIKLNQAPLQLKLKDSLSEMQVVNI